MANKNYHCIWLSSCNVKKRSNNDSGGILLNSIYSVHVNAFAYIFSVNNVIKDDTKIFCGFGPRVFFEFTIILTFLSINEEMLIFFRKKMICKDTF